MIQAIPATRRTDPLIPVGHPDFIWTAGADVQATWRKYGWVPPSEQRQQIPLEDEGALQTSQL